jgi:plastocyanin
MKKLFLLVLALQASVAFAADPEVNIVIRNHKFEPAEVTIPADKKVKLLIENKDSTAEEFESYAFAREKVVPANSSTTLYVGPLKAGRYPFFGDYHESTAKGVLIAK